MLQSGIAVYTALLFRGLIDNAVAGNRAEVKKSIIIIVSFVVFNLIAKFIAGYISERTKAKTSICIRSRLMNIIFNKDYLSVSAQHSGEILNKITNDSNVVSDGVIGIAPSVLGLCSRLVFAFIALMTVEPRFAIIFVAGGACMVGVTRVFRHFIKNLHKDMQKTEGKSRAIMQESLESNLVIRVFNAEEPINRKIGQAFMDNFKAKMKLTKVKLLSNFGFGAAFSAGYYFTFFWCIFKLINQSISYGTLTSILQLVGQIQSPVSGLSNILPWYYSIIASAERIMEIEDIPAEKDEETDYDASASYDKFLSIDFENVTFSYASDTIIENVDLSIRKGDIVAVTGISGIGKSTMMKLMLGVLNADSGKINVKFSDAEIPACKRTRGLFAYVPQGNMLMSGTILENITFFGQSGNKNVDEALKIACADGFINNLPDGLNTLIGERGYGLSEGQVQRIAIARAILNDAPILLLDEATSALDEQTEKQLLMNLQEQKDKTCIIITHKKAALDVCNRELRIVDKRVVSKILHEFQE